MGRTQGRSWGVTSSSLRVARRKTDNTASGAQPYSPEPQAAFASMMAHPPAERQGCLLKRQRAIGQARRQEQYWYSQCLCWCNHARLIAFF